MVFLNQAPFKSIPSPLSQAKILTENKNYYESLVALKNFNPKKEQYNEFCFLMSVNYFSLNDKENASKWVSHLLDSFETISSRHQTLAYMMQDDLKNWKEGNLNDIGRDMKISGHRLETAKAGEGTQQIQKQIIDKLDKLIKDQEDDKKAKADAEAQAQKEKEGKARGQAQGEQAAPDSTLPLDELGKGTLTDKQLKQVAQNWGSLPPAKREQVIQGLTRDLPPKYKAQIEAYFQSLNRMNPDK